MGLVAKVCTLTACITFANADEGQTTSDSIAQLRQRIEVLEKRLHEQPARKVDVAVKPVTASFDAQIYGFVRVDANYVTRKVDAIDWPSRVYAVTTDGDDKIAQFSMTPKFTNLGVLLSGPKVNGGQTSAKIEGDFAKDAISQGSLTPRLRQAYLRWEKDGWVMLGGQTDDLIYLVGPDQLNFNSLAGAGMLGFRHVQLQIGKTWDLNEKNSFNTKIAAVCPNEPSTGFPHGQACATWTTHLLTKKETKISVAGVVGKERVSGYGRPRVWATMCGAELPILEWLTFKGYLFTGQNLGYSYCGNIGQTYINPSTRQGARDSGGWAQITFTPIKKTAFNFGAAIDKPKKSQVGTAGDDGNSYFKNVTLYANAVYNFTDAFSLGAELARYTLWARTSTTTDAHKHTTGVTFAATYKF